MPNCVRQRLPGASIFFTLRIADPGSELLIRDVAALRAAFHRTLAERPCRIDGQNIQSNTRSAPSTPRCSQVTLSFW